MAAGDHRPRQRLSAGGERSGEPGRQGNHRSGLRTAAPHNSACSGRDPGQRVASREKFQHYRCGPPLFLVATDAPEPAGCRCGEVITGRCSSRPIAVCSAASARRSPRWALHGEQRRELCGVVQVRTGAKRNQKVESRQRKSERCHDPSSADILLGHGGGGQLMDQLLDEVVRPYIANPILEEALTAGSSI